MKKRKIAYESEIKKYYNIYMFFVKNKTLSYRSFMQKLQTYLNFKSISPYRVQQKINFMNKNISYSLANDMQTIFDYLIAQKEGNKEKILELYPKVKDIQLYDISNKKQKSASPIDNMNMEKQHKQETEAKENRINDAFDMVIGEKKTIYELVDDGRISSKNILTAINKSIKDIDSKKYIEFTKINNKLEPINEKELDQVIEVVSFFCENLKRNIDTYDQLINAEDILNFYVSGEKELSSCFFEDLERLRVWKKKRLDTLIRKYSAFKNILESFKENYSFEDIKALNTEISRILKQDSSFLIDYYYTIFKLANEYKRLSKINTAPDKKIEELKEEFKKQLILRNN